MLEQLFCLTASILWVPSKYQWEGWKQLGKRLFNLYVDFQFVLMEPFITFYIFQAISPM